MGEQPTLTTTASTPVPNSRNSITAGEQGATDAARGARGLADKLGSEVGHREFVGNTTPVFFIREPAKVPDFIRTEKCHPRTTLRSNTAIRRRGAIAGTSS